jgi:FKBP-type peptidyl-prolyl cis-trans isomerase SlyD
MEIGKNTVVAMNYTLTNNDGQILDTSEGRDPLYFLYGVGQIIPGLESALEGKSTGDALQVTVQPADGYGERETALIQKVPRDKFPPDAEIEVGMQFQASSGQGPVVVSVTEVSDSEVTVDGNHPLAGVTLNFDVSIVEVREATAEEIDHGHVHGPGGHQH